MWCTGQFRGALICASMKRKGVSLCYYEWVKRTKFQLAVIYTSPRRHSISCETFKSLNLWRDWPSVAIMNFIQRRNFLTSGFINNNIDILKGSERRIHCQTRKKTVFFSQKKIINFQHLIFIWQIYSYMMKFCKLWKHTIRDFNLSQKKKHRISYTDLRIKDAKINIFQL